MSYNRNLSLCAKSTKGHKNNQQTILTLENNKNNVCKDCIDECERYNEPGGPPYPNCQDICKDKCQKRQFNLGANRLRLYGVLIKNQSGRKIIVGIVDKYGTLFYTNLNKGQEWDIFTSNKNPNQPLDSPRVVVQYYKEDGQTLEPNRYSFAVCELPYVENYFHDIEEYWKISVLPESNTENQFSIITGEKGKVCNFTRNVETNDGSRSIPNFWNKGKTTNPFKQIEIFE